MKITKKRVKEVLENYGGWHFDYFYKESRAIITSYTHEKVKKALADAGVPFKEDRAYNKEMACTGKLTLGD